MHLLEHHFMMREERHNDYYSEAERKCRDLVIVQLLRFILLSFLFEIFCKSKVCSAGQNSFAKKK